MELHEEIKRAVRELSELLVDGDVPFTEDIAKRVKQNAGDQFGALLHQAMYEHILNDLHSAHFEAFWDELLGTGYAAVGTSKKLHS